MSFCFMLFEGRADLGLHKMCLRHISKILWQHKQEQPNMTDEPLMRGSQNEDDDSSSSSPSASQVEGLPIASSGIRSSQMKNKKDSFPYVKTDDVCLEKLGISFVTVKKGYKKNTEEKIGLGCGGLNNEKIM